MIKFGEKLKYLRLRKQWTQQQMANLFNQKYHYNLGKSAISQYENNKRIPEFFVLVDLAEFLEVSLDDLIRGSDKKYMYVNEHEETYRVANDNHYLDLEKMANEMLQLARQKRLAVNQRPLSEEQLQILENVLEIGVQLIKRK